LKCEFLKKFKTLTFDYYFETSNPVQHIRYFRDKMMVYSRNNALMCPTFPSSLNGVATDWFYSLLTCSFHSFKEIIKAFLTQYTSRRGGQK